ncbi:hypothetical protein J6590_088629 [Homalodisca vitripennis]|nr:hypothetical protein J6590_088629 [Homalodisca vitripennis]
MVFDLTYFVDRRDDVEYWSYADLCVWLGMNPALSIPEYAYLMTQQRLFMRMFPLFVGRPMV